MLRLLAYCMPDPRLNAVVYLASDQSSVFDPTFEIIMSSHQMALAHAVPFASASCFIPFLNSAAASIASRLALLPQFLGCLFKNAPTDPR